MSASFLSHGAIGLGFEPAFLDFDSQSIYLDGVPQPAAAKPHLIAGFVRRGFFYTRAQAARLVRDVAPG
jgi:hypothetical protein